ncbi:MAG TPA: hypothetical protein PKO06_13970 [Candidatus Ozemobacteraceae bacterium]|nr:hypothetical protein [Candidatus Ozemobacteraceae bacterium]
MILILIDALLLILAHVGTALIQSDAIRWDMRLSDLAGVVGMSSDLWIGVVLVFLALTVVRAVGNEQEKKQWRTLLAALSQRLGWRLWLLAALLMLPQRLMDTNSGYTCIQPESVLSLLLLGLDWSRTFAALIWLRRCAAPPEEELAARQPGPSDIATPRRSSIFWLGLLILTCGLIGQVALLKGIPRVQDEIIQEWQSRLFRLGALHTPPLPVRESFLPDPSIDENGTWIYSTYQPAYALLKALFQIVNLDVLLNPLLGVLCLLLLSRVCRQVPRFDVNRYAVVLFACSPFLLLMSASRMNHLLGLCCLLLAANGLAEFVAKRRWRGILLASVAVSLLLLTRRVEGAALALSLCVSLFLIAEGWAVRLGGSALITGAGVVAALVQSRWAVAIAGDPLLAVRHVQASATILQQLTPGLLWSNNLDNLLGFAGWAFGGGLAGWAGFALLRERVTLESQVCRTIETFFCLHATALILGYSWYYFQDFCYGPRYLFPLLPAAAWGAARLLGQLDTIHPRAGSRVLRLTIGVGILVMTQSWWAILAPDFWHIRADLASVIAEQVPTNSLVFLRHPARIRLDVLRQLRALRVSPELLQRSVVSDAVDYDAFLEALKRLPTGATEPRILELLLDFEHQARGHRPEGFAINGMEVIRLNHPFLGTGSRILALDLGDEPNMRLQAAYSSYQPVLLYRRGQRYGIASMTSCGLARFDEPRRVPEVEAHER